MCHGLHIHVLPFFRFYRGADGHLCSFSCTNATVSVSLSQYCLLVIFVWRKGWLLICQILN